MSLRMTTKKGFTHPNPVFSETSPGFICFSPGKRWPRLPACQSTGPRACADIVLSRSPAPVTAPRLLRAVRCGGSSSFISSPSMTITYSCIANGRAVLAELALTGGSYQEAAAAVLKLVLLRAEPKTMIQMGSFVYHTLFIDGITYLCASDNALDILTPSAFLKNVSETFLKNPLMSQEHFSPSNAVAADFQQVLGKYMAKESPQTMKTLRRIWRKHCKKIIIISMAILLSIIIILLSTNIIPT
ncbi:uncharacterized protein VAMP9 isoform X2 [Bos taurus]|uniref:uncharacterized protein VAMP9 isoform X2 n=1 Tax=Bos taurus TaxID=9913 RepID=UPI0028CB803F|nr:uncharacterized protein VAMP9 isoform X2 [Bos taurus]